LTEEKADLALPNQFFPLMFSDVVKNQIVEVYTEPKVKVAQLALHAAADYARIKLSKLLRC